ncbi:DUF1652 domain-containing protein [Pseudomonas sp. RIT-PI-S]|uniref:DUF1652 domain-containing protein n=1 Tax=Pseudomonas sp. RIT-PI-S TaxID=3035295 RepID=UPI0021D9AA9C|nr:DUF1652 domain-containing protein [Pseudomonas sp. RIT-PI-S]
MLSTLELRNIIESSFLPQRCQCTQGPDRSLTVKIFQANSDRADFMVTGIDTRQLNSSRAISNLIAGLRKDLTSRRSVTAVEQRRYASASL